MLAAAPPEATACLLTGSDRTIVGVAGDADFLAWASENPAGRSAAAPTRPGGIVTLANIAIYLALIVFVVARRMIGRPVGPTKKLFALPVIAIVIGWGDATRGLHKPVDITLTVAGCAISLVFGLVRGRADRMSTRDGIPYVQWTWLSLGWFAALLLVKLALDLAGIAAGETAAAAGQSLILTLGLTLLGEAAVIWYRSGGAGQLTSSRSADPSQLDS
jgi:hypothetical protein